jgi:NADPH:quinone reductase-like Zn-dependent oxidoreductase
VLRLRDVAKPVPLEGEVLLKVHAASVNIFDYYKMVNTSRVMGGGITKPKEPRVGNDAAGQVEAIGENVTRFRLGEEVFGTCPGSFAEYAVARESRLALKPANISFEEAAAVPVAGLTALECLRDMGRVQAGQNVAVNGASGGVGTFAVQIAKYFGANVTGVCSTRNVDQARSLGADHVVDYTRQDFTKEGRSYDLICDIAGNRSVSDYKRALKPGGTCLVVGFVGNPLLGILKFAVLGKLGSMTGGKKVRFMGFARLADSSEDLDQDLGFMAELLKTGKVKPVIERRYGLNEAGQALLYISGKHTRGKVVVTVS